MLVEQTTPTCGAGVLFNPIPQQSIPPSKRIRTNTYEGSPVRLTEEPKFANPSPFKAELTTQYVEQRYKRNQQRKKKGIQTEEFIFTLEDLKDIVNKAVAEREKEIQEEYDTILSSRLYEQYNAFARFNEDCISYKMKNSEFSYMS
jgi:hypothetical protein